MEWDFLRAMLLKMGICNKYTDMVMRCVTTARCAVRVNGCRTASFTPTRGIRQGAEGRPYLFVLCASGFSAMLRLKEERKVLRGVRFGNVGITHLFFADDSIIFVEASARGIDELKDVLSRDEAASGQKVNQAKSSMIFGSSCPVSIRAMVKEKLHIDREALNETYLGLPSSVGRLKGEAFHTIMDQVENQVKWVE